MSFEEIEGRPLEKAQARQRTKHHKRWSKLAVDSPLVFPIIASLLESMALRSDQAVPVRHGGLSQRDAQLVVDLIVSDGWPQHSISIQRCHHKRCAGDCKKCTFAVVGQLGWKNNPSE
jgi:hypothetical protein